MRIENGMLKMETALRKVQMAHGIKQINKKYSYLTRLLVQNKQPICDKMVFKVCSTAFRVKICLLTHLIFEG